MDDSSADNTSRPPDDSGPADSSLPMAGAESWTVWLRSRWKSLLLVLLVVAAATSLTWQRIRAPDTGLSKDAKKALDDKTAGQIKDPFTFGPFTVRPSETDRIEAGIKPGHWTAASLEVRSNFDDFRGDVSAEMVSAGGDGIDLDNLAFRLRSIRPAVLPKLQKKVLDVAIFDPVQNFSRQVAPRLLSRSGRDVWNARELLTPMPQEQFFFVVLADRPDDYRYLMSMDSVWAPHGSVEDRGMQAHYRVLFPRITLAAPLPSQPLFWTNTAVLLWDELDPERLSPDQQQSLIDWLHWGGQLIVSGPGSLELLRGTLLDGVLPAGPGEAWELSADTLAPLARATPEPEKGVRVVQPWTGVHLNLEQRNAHALVETDDHKPLIAERRIGRGRTVVTAFRLGQRDLVNWSGYDALFNAALLRRTSRRFDRSPEDRVRVAWADGVGNAAPRVSNMRYFSRDEGHVLVPSRQEDANAYWMRTQRVSAQPQGDNPFDNAFDEAGNALLPIGSGVAGWDDESPVSNAARSALRTAAGIQVPRRALIMSLLAAYVFVLVPLNWLACRLLGRVELAWLVAPLVAIVFGLLVVRIAQLDIGFARSMTEVSILEVQGDYPRAHLTRYRALYTSLSTSYTIDLGDPSAVALPFATGNSLAVNHRSTTVTLRQQVEGSVSGEPALRLEDFDVSSNSTGMIHSEEMRDLAGSLVCKPTGEAGKYRLHNGTSLRLEGVTILAAMADLAAERRQGRIARCDRLEPGGDFEFTLSEVPGDLVTPGAQAAAAPAGEAMDLSELLDLACNQAPVGELRLVARTADELPGMTVQPAANQARWGTVVIAHLGYGPESPLAIDFNSRHKVAESLPEGRESTDFLSPTAEAPSEPPASN